MRLPTISGEFRATADPELRFTPSGKAVCSLTVVASESKKTDTGWEDGDRSPFLRVTLWDGAAEAAAEAITKGQRVLVTGALFEREYDKSDGTKGRSVEVKFATVAVVPGRRAERSHTPPASDPWATSQAPF
jgi:single-strand DNA-binding protein